MPEYKILIIDNGKFSSALVDLVKGFIMVASHLCADVNLQSRVL